jgi:hypothetical protein
MKSRGPATKGGDEHSSTGARIGNGLGAFRFPLLAFLPAPLPGPAPPAWVDGGARPS